MNSTLLKPTPLPHVRRVMTVADQIRHLTQAIGLSDPGPTRDELIARRDKLIADRMTALVAGRTPPRLGSGYVRPLTKWRDR